MQATNSSGRFEVTTDGTQRVSAMTGAALLRDLADRLELTGGPTERSGPRQADPPTARTSQGSVEHSS